MATLLGLNTKRIESRILSHRTRSFQSENLTDLSYAAEEDSIERVAAASAVWLARLAVARAHAVSDLRTWFGEIVQLNLLDETTQ